MGVEVGGRGHNGNNPARLGFREPQWQKGEKGLGSRPCRLDLQASASCAPASQAQWPPRQPHLITPFSILVVSVSFCCLTNCTKLTALKPQSLTLPASLQVSAVAILIQARLSWCWPQAFILPCIRRELVAAG